MYRLLAALLLVLGVSHGNTVTIFFTGLPTDLQNNAYGSSNATYNGYSTVTINGIPMEVLVCDDFTHTTFIPSSQDLIYDYSTLTDPNPLQYANFASEGITTYEVADVLLTELAALTNPSAETITDYQYAIWHLFDPAAPANTGEPSLVSDAEAYVATHPSPSDYANLVIYTPTSAFSSNQEFLGLNTTVGPEPALWPVFGLLLLGAAWRWFRPATWGV